MSAKTPKQTENKPTRKKLRLSKETLKDLTDPRGGAKGGAPEETRGKTAHADRVSGTAESRDPVHAGGLSRTRRTYKEERR
jgi:hypothetical protein